MRKKAKIVTHGNTWIDTSAPIVCPECASLNVKEYTYNDSEWHGPFLIGYEKKIYSCKDCDCRFKISKDKKSIKNYCLDELSGIIALCSVIILIVLVIISNIFWNDDLPLPMAMAIAITVGFIITLISFIIWLMNV